MKKKFCSLFTLVLLLLALSALMTGCRKNPLVGSWRMDAVTSYVFEKDGTGSMDLPLSRNPFTYTVEGDQVTIQFEDAALETRSYTFSVEGDTMILTYVFGDQSKDYTLTRAGK